MKKKPTVSQEIELPFITKSLNDIMGMHYRTRANYVKEIKEQSYYYIKEQGYKPWGGKYPVDISFIIQKKDKRKGDSDNWTGKAIMDSLVLAGILPDDNTNYVRVVSYQLVYGDRDKTTIKLNSKP